MDEHKLIYTAGHNVVIYNAEDKHMQFFPGLEVTVAITCVTLSPLRRHLAVAEKAEPAIIVVYDTHTQRKKKKMSTPDSISPEIVSMAFAPGQENKFLISMGGAPDWTLIYWQWERPRVMSYIRVSNTSPVYQVSFNIHDHSQAMIATGEDVFRWYKLQDESFKVMATQLTGISTHSSNYLSHCWLRDNRLLVGTDRGELLVIENNCEVVTKIMVPLEDFQIYSIINYEGGFLAGGSKGRVVVYTMGSDERRVDYTLRNRVIHADRRTNCCIKSMSVSFQTEELLVMALDNSQLYSVHFHSDKEDAEPMMQNYHSGAITGMDVCIRKPLVVTCGEDNSVRIWNYIEHSLEVMSTFNEEPYSVAFHPSGFHIVVGFADKLRMMNIFNNSIKSYKDINIRACTEVRFSHGGHLFAAATGSYIKVFSFYTGESPPHMEFKGHSNRVKSIAWTDDDTGFVTAGMDGAVYEWRLYPKNGVTHAQEFHQKGVIYTSVIVAPDTASAECRTIYAVGNDRFLKEIFDNSCPKRLETGMVAGQIALNHSGKLLFAGMSEPEKPGAVRCYKFGPLTGDYTEYQAHSLPIERIRVSQDDCYLFTSGQDGVLIIWEIKDKDVRTLRKEKEALGLPYAEEIMITKGEIEELQQAIENLLASNRDMETNNKMTFEMALQEKQDLVEKLKEQMSNDAEQDKNKFDSLAESKKEAEQQYQERIQRMKELFENEKQEMETQHQQNFMVEVGRYQELSRDREIEAKAAQDKIEQLVREHEITLRRKEEENRLQLEQEKAEILMQQKAIHDQKTRYKLIEEQLEKENQQELNELVDQNNKDIRKIKDESLQAKGKNSLAERKQKMLEAERDKLEDEIKAKREEKDHQEKQIQKQKEKIGSMRVSIGMKDMTISNKEKKIFDLKQKNQNLEKYKFVLDYKIRDLKRDIVPREEEIAKMKERTSEMDKELKFLSGLNESLGGFVDELRKRQQATQADINDMRNKIRDSSNKIKAIKDGIYDCVQHIQDFRKLKESILKLFNQYVKTEGKAQEPDTEKEFARQCKYLENSIGTLRTKLKVVSEAHQQENMRIMQENMELIEEIYKLRSERKNLSYIKRQYELATLKTQPKKTSKHEDMLKQMERNKDVIRELRKRIAELESSSARPSSQGRLPPLEQAPIMQ